MTPAPTSPLPRGLARARGAVLLLTLAWLALLAVDWVVLPEWGARAGGPNSPVPRARALVELVQGPTEIAWACSLLVFWALLTRFAARAGGATYAGAHLVLSILLTPVALTGVLVVPLVVAREVEDGTAARRRATMRLGWLDLVFVLGCGGALAIWALF